MVNNRDNEWQSYWDKLCVDLEQKAIEVRESRKNDPEYQSALTKIRAGGNKGNRIKQANKAMRNV